MLSEIKTNEIIEDNYNNNDDMSFQQLYEESLQNIHEGKIVKGVVVQIDKEFVLVDIGYKSEGQIRISEFIDQAGELTVSEGDKIDVLLVKKEDNYGRTILSKEKAIKAIKWKEMHDAYLNHDTIKGKIISQVKGGLFVDIGLQAFLPGSQADIRPVRNLGSLIGKELEFIILKCEENQGNIVLSRRAVLEKEREEIRKKTLKLIEEDAILDGIVSNVTDYGLFVDLGGIDGLVHITEMSWGKVGHPSELYHVGESIKVKVLEYNDEKGRVSLSIKQLVPDPWSTVQEKYPIGTIINGKVSALMDYGAFVEVEEGMEGLIHVSEMSWTEKIKHPGRILSLGNDVEAIITGMDTEKKRISLSIKQLKPNPWDRISENYPIGSIIESEIKNITDFGMFIGIDDGIDGLIHISDISWTKRINHPSEIYKKGDTIQSVVLEINKDEARFSLGIKQLTPDPWDLIPEKYQKGTRVTGIVKSVTDFGMFVELEEGIEGLVHISQLSKDKNSKKLEDFKIGDNVEAEVVNVSKEEKKIGLSIHKLEQDLERGSLKNYLDNNKKATSNLGDLLKEKMIDI